jgi:hypothetical protein
MLSIVEVNSRCSYWLNSPLEGAANPGMDKALLERLIREKRSNDRAGPMVLRSIAS